MFFTAGGLTKGQAVSKVCEQYNINNDRWEQMPSLPEPLYSLSLSVFQENCLFAVGGLTTTNQASSAIFFIDLTKRAARWESIAQRLPNPLS